MTFLFPSAPAGLTGQGGLPWIGALVPFARDPLGFIERQHRDYGDLSWFRLVEHDLYLIALPELVEAVLVRSAKSLHKDAIYELMRPMLGDGLVTAEDEVWKRHRKLAAPSFAKKHVDGYAAEMVQCTERWLATLPAAPAEGSERDLHAAFMQLTQDIVLRTLFGGDLDSARLEGAAHAIDAVMDDFAAEAQGPRRLLPKGVPTPGRRRAKQAIAALDAAIYGLIAARRERGLGDDLLSRLIEARDEDGGLTDRELRDEAVTAFVAGHETTALALTYAVHLVAQDPAVQARLEAEVDDVLGDRAGTPADLGRLKYTKAVIQESMRLLPPAWAIGREAMEDLEVGGVRIPKGAQVLVSPWLLHRDPRWFADPLVFRPERWLEGLEESLPRCAYMPFGAGPRICIGNHFAMLEAVLVLATVARRARITDTTLPKLQPTITLRPKGPVRGRISRR